jgi:winged helix DNA-binding protein
MEKHAFRFRVAGVSMEEYEALKPRLLDAAHEPISAKELQEHVPVEGKLPTIVRIMCVEGLMLRIGGSLRSDNLRYVSTEAWLGHPLEAVDPEASLSWLAEAYLRAFGPARISDVAWWIGIPKGRAKTALANAELTDIGEGLLLPADLVDDFYRVDPIDSEAIDLLPKWDAYTMGLAGDGRQRFLNDEHRSLAYTTKASGGGPPGDGYPLVLQGGRAIASWSHRFTGDRMQVTISPFEPGPMPESLNEESFAGIGALLGAKKIGLLA